MINMHSQSNINGVKNLVDLYNNQMTNQNKISKPSDDPVIAIRSLRLRDSLHEVDQYVEKNIPDAESWMEITETSLTNMEELLDDIYDSCVYGSNGILVTEDRKTLIENLSRLVEQLYAEGNSDYAGRTVFTGYKTNKTLTFPLDDNNAEYTITEKLNINDLSVKSYYTNTLNLPNNDTEVKAGYAFEEQMKKVDVDRIRLAYDGLTDGQTPSITVGGQNLDGKAITYTDENGNTVNSNVTITIMPYETWRANDFAIAENEAYFIPETGELILGSAVSSTLKMEAANDGNYSIEITYDKKGFDAGDVRPEMYFDCIDKTDAAHPIEYEKELQDISYTISANLEMKVNTQASEDGILSTSIARDVQEMLDAVTQAQNAADKVVEIENMLKSTKYADEESQKALNEWLDAAKREETFANDNFKTIFENGITLFQGYKEVVELAKTDVGSRANRVELVKNRMETQQSTLNGLISKNEDRELSDVLIDYKAAYTAYESALTAASKANSITLLEYLR